MEFTLRYRSKIVIDAIRTFISKEKKVLDIGCGNGVVSHEIQRYFNCDLTGTDILEYLKRDIRFKKMKRIDKLDFSDKQFDVGLFIDVLHHVPAEAQIKLIKEGMRVSRGILIFEVEPTFIAKLVDFIMNKIHYPKMPILLTHRTREEWTSLFRDNNIYFESHKVKTRPFYLSTNHLFYIRA